MTDQEKAAAIWAEAIERPQGLWIRTTDVQRLVQLLYEHKRKSSDLRLLQFTISQRGSVVLIARTKPEIKSEGKYAPLED